MAVWTGGCVVDGVATLKGIECAVGNFLGAVLGLAGIVVFVMLITAGFKYMTSRGDPKAVEAAKSAMTHAVAGVVVLVFAYVFLLIIEAATGIPVTKFRVTTP